MIAVGICATVVVIGLYAGGALDFLELDSVDARFAVRGTEKPPAKLILVVVDQNTLADLGVVGTFIPRSWHAKVIRRIAHDHPRVIAYDFTFDSPSPGFIQNGLADDDQLIHAVHDAHGKVVLATDSGGGGLSLGQTEKQLLTLGTRAGSVRIPNQPTIRRMPLAVDGITSFPLLAAQVAQGKSPSGVATKSGSAWIDFYGPPGTLRQVSFEAVLAGRTRPGYFGNAIVVVGASAASLLDLHPTATSGDGLMSGPEINANAIETAIRGFPLTSTSTLANLALIVLLGLVVPGSSLRLGMRNSLALGVVGGFAFVLAAQLAFNSGLVVDFVYPLLALTLSSVSVLGARYALAGSDPRFVRIETVGIVIGSDVAGYRVERLLGRGGGGTVYVATETALRRKVALKVLNPELADSEAAQSRFLRESQLAAALDHPNVVPIYRAGEDAGYFFLAMKLIRGSLITLLRRDRVLDVERALSIAARVAAALDAAHAVGLIHRDVTPSNILLDPPVDGVDGVYLADFGLTQHRGFTSGTGLVGKPEYVSPEQIRGDAVDGRADLYSLACVLFECLTGDPPFVDASEITVIGSHLSRTPVPPSSLRRDLPPSIDEPFARALAKTAGERQATCTEFVDAVRAACPGKVPDSLSAV